MSLKVWLPLVDDSLINKGTANLTFVNTSSSDIKINNSGKIGKCWERINSNGSYIYSKEKVNLTLHQSMFCWVNFSSLQSSSSLTGICGNHRYNKGTGMGITIRDKDSKSGYVSLDTGRGNSSDRTYNTYYGSTLLKAGEWNHIGYTYDGSTIKIYVNGKLDKQVSYSGQKVVDDYIYLYGWSLGGDGTGVLCYPAPFKLNDVRMYDNTLSDLEVEELSRGLVAQYKFNGPNIENTINLCSKIAYDEKSKGTWGWTTSEAHYIDLINEPVPNNKGTKLITTYDSTKPWGGTCVYAGIYNIKPNTKYCYSTYIKATDNFSYVHENFLYSYQFNSSGKKLTEFGVASSSRKIYIGNGWYRFWGTFTSQKDASYINLYFFSYPTHDVTYLLTSPQLEEKDHLTSYIYGARNSNILYDNSGNDYNGIIHGNLKPINSSPRNQLCYYMGAYQDPYIDISNIVDNSSLSNCTVTFWAKFDDGITLLLTGQSGSYYLMAADNGNFYHANFGSVSVYRDGVKGNYNTDKGNWHFYAVKGVNLSGVTKLYLNNYSSHWKYGGTISDLRIYATSLSDDDIKDLYSSPIKIANNKNLITDGEFIEDDGSSFDKNGNIHCKELKESDEASIGCLKNLYFKEFIEV